LIKLWNRGSIECENQERREREIWRMEGEREIVKGGVRVTGLTLSPTAKIFVVKNLVY